MKEYKVMDVRKNKAEKIMNEMAKEGWEVVSTNYWYRFKFCVMITFAREI